jgi:hypothetical protein
MGEGADSLVQPNSRASETGGVRRNTGSLVTLALTLATILVGALSIPGQAGADEPFRIAFDENEIELGPISNLPIGQISSGASIEGTVDAEGNVSIPKAKFTLPVLGIDEPVEIRGFMGIEDDATGTWDPKTGKLEIEAKAGLWLSIDIAATIQALQGAGVNLGSLGPLASIIGALGDLTCGFSPMDVTFTTETTPLGSGQRFSKGLNGPGALTAQWSELGPFAGKTRVLFLDVCTTIRGLAPTLLSGLAGNVIPGLDLGGLDIGGLLQNLDNVDLGPSALTITRTVDESTPPDLRLLTSRKVITVRAGRTARIPMRISNTGESPATGVTLCPRPSKSSGITARCIQVGTVGPGSTITRQIALTPKRSSRARSGRTGGGKTRSVRFSVVASGPDLVARSQGFVLRVVG